MDKQPTKMPKPFDGEDEFNTASAGASNNSQQFVLCEDDRLKQEEDFRQGKLITD